MNRANDIQVLDAQPVQSLTVQDMLNRVLRIREIQEKVMKQDVDYGLIPGCGPKPTLLKPGAETLLLAFEMAAVPDQMTITDLGDEDEVRYRIVLPIVHVPTGRLCGNGVGECSSHEQKYMWREQICQEEFDATDPGRRRVKYGKKKEGGFYTVNQIRTNKADVANTILKMGKKRALIDGALTVLAASRIFTQDKEDLPEELRDLDNGGSTKKAKEKPSNEMKTPNYGPEPAKPISQVSTEHLQVYIDGAERSIADPKKVSFLQKNKEQLETMQAEMAKRTQAPQQTTDTSPDSRTGSDGTAVKSEAPLPEQEKETHKPLHIDDACWMLEQAQTPKQISDIMNQAEREERSAPDRKRLKDNYDIAVARVSRKGK